MEGFGTPYSWMLKSIVIYRLLVFCLCSFLIVRGGLSIWRRVFRAVRFAIRLEFHLSLIINIRAKYFIFEQVGIEMLFIKTCRHVTFISENVMEGLG